MNIVRIAIGAMVAASLAAELDLHRVPSFHRDLVRGVASYWMEFFEAVAGDLNRRLGYC